MCFEGPPACARDDCTSARRFRAAAQAFFTCTLRCYLKLLDESDLYKSKLLCFRCPESSPGYRLVHHFFSQSVAMGMLACVQVGCHCVGDAMFLGQLHM